MKKLFLFLIIVAVLIIIQPIISNYNTINQPFCYDSTSTSSFGLAEAKQVTCDSTSILRMMVDGWWWVI